ncbi:MAG: ABC transporter substrate-binding protein [Gammaproteobacteria bacterium]|nr:ABC transporter substrate-binding protein [Gammaproteobacteria bacterium]
MQAEGVDVRARRELLHDTVADSFDVPTIVRLSLGRAWQTLSDDDRSRIEQAQFELILTTYAARFRSDGGERFVTAGAQSGGAAQVRVRTRIESPGASAVTLDYLLRDVDGEPRIFNVIADGFSELSMRRAEYTAIFERGGVQALLQEIDRLVAGNLERGQRS